MPTKKTTKVKAAPKKRAKPVAKVTKKVTRVTAKPVVKTAAKPAVRSAVRPAARCELWSYDEYNQGSIVAASPDVEVILKRALQYVHDANYDNALAMGEKDKALEAYFPQILKNGKVDTSSFYAGNKRDGKHYMWVQKDGQWVQELLPATVKVRILLGEQIFGRERSPWFLTDHLGREITDVNSQLLERKTVLFVKMINQ